METRGRKKFVAEPALPARDPRDDNGSEDFNPFGGGNPLLTKETESEPIIWDIGDEEEEYPFVNKYPSFNEEPIMFVEDESCLVYDTDNEKEDGDKDEQTKKLLAMVDQASVASCLSKITRITAPYAPFGDEEMKEVFQLVVSLLEDLSDESSRTYPKRVSIVENIVKVKSCLIVLDLECDDLIVEMFEHFMKSVWNACKPNNDDSEQPNHEMDVLAGHENDVNYVQFSGSMCAGYDGKTIVWDIWEGVPIRIFKIGRFKLVDGNFLPNRTSLVLSDEVGQLYILSIGQGEAQNDAKYDQFFLGDYRPLIQDIHGNVLDLETQLAPYQRNIQDLLCDSGMISYLELLGSKVFKELLLFRLRSSRSIQLGLTIGIRASGKYDLWLMRIEQYILMTDYSLWEVITNGNKVLKSTIGINAKLLMEAIEKRYGGNKESKKVQRTLLKQRYENFPTSSSKTLDQTFDRLQKLISKLEILGEVIQQEDMNLKLLRSLPSEWKTHALIWRNKAWLETISLDDLYNNLKIYEPEILGSSHTNQNPQNMAFVSSNSTCSTNEAHTTTGGVSTAHTQGTTVNSTSVDGNRYNKKEKIQAKSDKTEHRTESVEELKVNKKSNPTINLFPPLDNPELTIRRRYFSDPTVLNDSKMATEGLSDLPVPDLRTLEELWQPSLNGRNSCQFHGLPGDDANKHLDKFLHVTQSIKVNGVIDDAFRLYLFPHSLTHHATAWFDHILKNSINNFEHMAKMFLEKYFPPSMMTKLRNEITNFCQHPDESLFKTWERYKLSIDRCPNHNMLPITQIDTFYNGLTLRHRDTINAADTSAQQSESSNSITFSSDTEIAALKDEMAKINKNLMRVLQVNQQVKAVTLNYETFCGPYSFSDCLATIGNTQNIYATGAYQGHQPPISQQQVVTTNEFTNFMKENDAIIKSMQTNMTSLTNSNLELKNMFGQFMKMNIASSSSSGTLPGNTITNPKEDLKGITTQSGTAYQGPTIPTTSSYLAPKPNQRPSIPYPSRLHDQKLRDKSNDQREKFFQIFKDLNFNISFVDALILMQKFGPSIISLLTNKDKLCELARTLLNEYYSVVLLKKLPKKLGDPGKFLIPCDFPKMAECLALADLGANINIMPLSVWNKLSLPNLSPTCMTLELADRSISRPVGVAEDVFVKVGTFHFPAEFVVVDFDDDPRVPLILRRSFLKIGRALIDVFEGELTLRIGKEAITFNLDHTSRYSANYNDMTANRIDIIDMACEEYSHEVLGFSDMIASGNPTPYYDPIVSTTSLTLTPFGNNDFLLEEVDTFLALEDDPTSPKVD
nr:reverse transcriptase domain-containing protein [Tanacetum cinerariifolium]